MKREELIETALFSVGPFLALVAASRGVKSWLRFEIASAFVIAIGLVAAPKYIFPFVVS